MRRVCFLANPSSPHVRHWEMLLQKQRVDAIVYGIPEEPAPRLVAHPRELGPPFLRVLPKALRYLGAGVWLRLNKVRHQFPFVHAHSASGYGLVAWLSGSRYGVTTYGSEVYEADKRGWIYRFLLKRILLGADFITTTSSEMTRYLISKLGVPAGRISEFSLGVSDSFRYSDAARRNARAALRLSEEEIVWFANRRIHPHYRTKELVQAFANVYRSENRGALILLEGDSDRKYLEQLSAEISRYPGIRLVRGFLSQDELSELLCAADFTISIPRSDQLSSAILESAACRAIPVVVNLEAYGDLRSISVLVDPKEADSSEGLEQIFRKTLQIPKFELEQRRCEVEKFVTERYSAEVASKAVLRVYTQTVSTR